MRFNDSSCASVNRPLSMLLPSDLGLLGPYLEAVSLPVREQLEIPGKLIDHIYFIESGIASVVAKSSGDHGIEIGLIGREGMTGLAVLMGTDHAVNDTFMQVEGNGQRIATGILREAMDKSRTLNRSLLQYGHAFVTQIAHTAMANGRSKIEERLARWLLMAHDRIDGNELPLTHEFLSKMLGVHRPRVTVALSQLERQRLIEAKRGVICIVDRHGLEENSNGAYEAPEAEYKHLFG